MKLSEVSEHLILSTRIARFAPDGTDISGISCAYLLGPDESNADPTNFWIFSYSGLCKALERAQWEILAEVRGTTPSVLIRLTTNVTNVFS